MINSLDEAIKNCEKVADGFDEKAQEIAMQDENGVYQPRVSWYQDMASSQRQLVEWLRELKKYRAIFVKVGKILADNGYTIDDLDTIFGKVNREANADDK